MHHSLFQETDMSSPYLILAQSLLLEILSGRMLPLQKLPPVSKIAECNGICATTAQRALDVLQREGLIITERTKGKYITSDVTLIKRLKHQYVVAQIDCLIKKLYALGLQDCEIREILLNRLL